MPADPRIVRAVDAFAGQRQLLTDRITAAVLAELDGFDGWYDDSLVAEVVAAVAVRVAAGQKGIAALTDAYLARVTSLLFERAVSGAGVPASMGQTLRVGPADQTEVYRRIPAAYRYLRSLGDPLPVALDAVTQRAQEMVGTDLGLAYQHQVRRFNETRGVERYRRVIRSEKACGLCAVASDRVYYRADLLPIHARCRCSVIAFTEGNDPGSLLNGDTLRDLYAAAGGTAGKKLKRVRAVVVQHGELGPQLRVEGQHFRGPADVAA